MTHQFVLTVHESARRWRPWWGTITHGVWHVGEPGAGVYWARSRPRLVSKMGAACARIAAESGADLITLEVRET